MENKITTFVVNMEKDFEKRKSISLQLKKTKLLDWHIISACEGKRLSSEELKSYGFESFKTKYGSFGTLPAFGCSISHWQLYKKIVEENISVALILEDDALICEDTEKVASDIAQWLNTKSLPIAILLTPDFIFHNKSKAILQSASNKVEYVLRNITTGYMTSGYMLNLAAAKLLAEKLFPINYIADCWSDFHKFGLHLMGVGPHVVSYSGELGEIGRSQHSENEPMILRIRHKLGRLKAQINGLVKYAKGYRKSEKKW